MRCHLTARARFTNPEMLCILLLFPALLAIFTLELYDVVNERRLLESFCKLSFVDTLLREHWDFLDDIGFNTLGDFE
jgi:hypothetical protein